MTFRKFFAVAVSVACVVFLAFKLSPRSTRAGSASQTSQAAAAPITAKKVAASNPVTLPPLQINRTDLAIWIARQNQEPAFAGFASWVEDYITGRTSDTVHGAVLTGDRHEHLAQLTQSDPDRALELAMSPDLIAALPPDIAALAEEHVNGRGRLAVLGAVPEPGHEKQVVPTFRTATLNGKEYRAFTYGRRLGEPTRNNILLHGIALPSKKFGALLAVHESPARLLSKAEAARVKAPGTDPICAISGLSSTVNNTESVLDVGGTPIFTCGLNHAAQLQRQIAASDGENVAPGAVDGDAEPSAYTEGRKRLLFIRVDFPDLQGPPFTDLAGMQLITNMANYWRDASYGKTTVAMPGQGVGQSSDLTPTFRMAKSAAYYATNDYYAPLRAEARAAADANGYYRTNYEFHIICIGPVPGFGWGGLGYVGGTGAWIRNTSSTGAAGHELGHNLGLNHGTFWDTSAQSVIGPGTSVEYGDGFDTMGGGGSARPYNARYRAYLNWLTTNDVATFSTNGVYRITAYDVTTSTGVRALKLVRNSGNDVTNQYWLEYHAKSGVTSWELNGAELRWAGSGNQKSQLLDTTPGSPDGKNDAAIAIGRTFVDKVFGIFITPLRRVGTTPDSIDIFVHRGQVASNVPPVLAITATTTNPAASALVTFTATASDPNGDVLAYHWDFGDGTFGTNGVVISKSWSAGEYVVRCTVTDMRGGEASDSLIMRVGAPTTFRISGRVLENGNPLQGVRVFASSTRVTYTDSDGYYNIVGLGAGSYTVSAVLDGYSFSHPTFNNPVSVGPNAAGVDFAAGSAGTSTLISVVPQGAEWKYLDNGSNQGTNWIFSTFNDVTWNSGPAELGYGDGDEATIVAYGPNASAKYITTYFRHQFFVDDPSQFPSLTLGLLRDDGGVVYLNGREVFRSNMPATQNYLTPASTTVDAANESTFFETDLNPNYLVAAANQFAGEIHQANGTSSDISFDLYLKALSITNLPRGGVITSPIAATNFTEGDNVPLPANASGGAGGSISNVEFFIGDWKLGQSAARPFTATWSNAAFGTHTLVARASDAAGVVLTSAPVTFTVGKMVLPRGSIWKYSDIGQDMGSVWRLPAFNDASWASGAARLGYGGDGEVTTINYGPNPSAKYPTAYFRPRVSVPGQGNV